MAFSKSSKLFLTLLFGFVGLLPFEFLSAAQAPLIDTQLPHEVTIHGEVTSSGEPVTGAFVYVFQNKLIAKTDSGDDGRFKITLDSDDPVNLLIGATGKLSQIRSLDPNEKPSLKIQLGDQKAPLQGRIIDNQGMGVSDANLRILSFRNNDQTTSIPPKLNAAILDSTTNQEGRFRFIGIARSMLGQIQIKGQGIVTSSLTRDSFDDEIVLIAQPSRTITGKVIDRVTNQAVPNVEVSLADFPATAQVDASGKFTMTGIPAFQPVLLLVNPTGDKPYLSNAKRIPVENGLASTEVEVMLEPGVQAKCIVKDFASGGPATAELFYFPTPENENFQAFVELFLARRSGPSSLTDSNGEAKIVAMPGPGVVAIFARGFPPNESVKTLTDQQRAMLTQATGRNDLTAVEWIDPKDLNDGVEVSFLVSKGRSINVEVALDQVKPTDYLVVHRAASMTSLGQRVQGPSLVAAQFHPGETRRLLIHSIQNELSAIVDIKAESDSPVKVSLEPTGSLTGQIVDKDGRPQSGLAIKFEVPADDGYQEIALQVFTDANGRFHKPSLIASLEYRIAAVRLSNRLLMTMDNSPKMDSRWYVAEDLKINSAEEVDLGSIVLGATEQPKPERTAKPQTNQTDSAEAENKLPSVISGVVTNEMGEPIAGAAISFNTWPNRSGNLKKDSSLMPIVLAQSKSSSSGAFQMSIDGGLEKKLISSESNDGKHNVAVVISSEKRGTVQIPLSLLSNPQHLKIQMNREMIVRGKIVSEDEQAMPILNLVTGTKIEVYDTDSVKQIVESLQQGVSMEKISKTIKPVSILDPLSGGLPLKWQISSSGSFLARNIPLNAIFELHVIDESGKQKTITVLSRPTRGFEFKPTENTTECQLLQGSRVRFDWKTKAD